MGLYTETLLERAKKEEKLMQDANRSLREQDSESFLNNPLDELQLLLAYLFDKFNIKYEAVHGCKTTLELMECVLDTHKIMYETIEFDNHKWKKSNCYIIAYLENGAPILLVPTLFGYRYLRAGESKLRRLNKNVKLQNVGYMIFAPLPKKISSLGGMIKFILKSMNPRYLIGIVGMTLIIALLALLTPIINDAILGSFLESSFRDYKFFYALLFAFIGIGLVSSLLTGFKKKVNDTAGIEACAIVEKGLMSRILMLPYSYFTKKSAGTLSKYMYNSTQLTTKIVNILLGTVLTFLFSFISVPQLFVYAPGKIAWIVVLILLVQVALSLIVAFITAKNERYVLEAQTEAENIQYSTLRGIQKIKGVGAEKRFYAKWAKSYQRYLNYHLNPPTIVKLNSIYSILIADVTTIVILALAFPMEMTVAEYIAFDSALIFISTAATQLTMVIKDFIGLMPLVDYLKPIINMDIEDNNQLEYVTRLNGNIRLEHISFLYDENGGKLLDDLNLNIKQGEKIAIVGESGCGKSTLIKLILGLLEPQSGCIYFDGHPASSLNSVSLRQKITSVCQFNKLFPGTIFSNMKMGNPTLTYDEAWEALKKSDIYDDVKAYPLGLDTEINESVMCGFSGGQRQRILLARAFASKNNILILDEATSALDNKTQDTVLKHVYESKATVIMVAHRLSTVVDCDRILVFKEGKIVEDGKYNDLMKKDGYFATLMKKQQLKENN